MTNGVLFSFVSILWLINKDEDNFERILFSLELKSIRSYLTHQKNLILSYVFTQPCRMQHMVSILNRLKLV